MQQVPSNNGDAAETVDALHPYHRLYGQCMGAWMKLLDEARAALKRWARRLNRFAAVPLYV